jgi:membrane-bound lytic murein transglycosylase D
MTGHARSFLIAFALVSSGACARVAPVTSPDPVADTAASVPAAMEALSNTDRKAEIAEEQAQSAKRITLAEESARPESATLESPGTVATSRDAEPVAPPVRAEASWDIEVRDYLDHDRVEFYIKRFTGSARPTIVSWLQRGLKYEPMIRKTFRETGIAEDMYYLGLVESGYDPHAYSRAAAVGMWQFMTATARGVGLRVDWWVDERRDPMKSTKAAARFLSSLEDQFGSLYLAAAAYNGGPARVSRGLTRYADDVGESEGDDQFFALAETRALRSETMNYVPQLIAAAAIGKEPWTYGITLDSVAPYAYDSVLAPPATAVAALTFVTGAPLDSLRDHNPHLLRGATPPGEPTWVRVPRGYATATSATELLAMPDSLRAAWMAVKARKATSVSSMAKAYGMTVNQLRWYNPRLKGTQVPAGTTVNVPTKLAISGAFNVGDPSIERYGAAVNGVHIVRRGETLSHIASRNNTSVSRLMALNGLKKNVIYPGQAIRVRGTARKVAKK